MRPEVKVLKIFTEIEDFAEIPILPRIQEKQKEGWTRESRNGVILLNSL